MLPRISVVACLAALALPGAALAQIVEMQAKCAPAGTYVEVGQWEDSTAEATVANPCGLGSRATRDPGAYAEFTPQVPEAGTYSVYVCWGVFIHAGNSNKGPNAETVEYSILDSNGNQTLYLNQRGQENCVNRNNDAWLPIGSGYFTPEGGGSIRITNTSDSQCHNGPKKRFVNVDAVRLVLESPTPVEALSWGLLKSRYTD